MYPLDRRVMATHIYSIFKSLRKTAYLLKVSHMTISRWISKPERKIYERNVISKTKMITETIRMLTHVDPRITLEDFVKKIKDLLNIDVSKDLIRVVRKKLNLTPQKIKFYPRPKTSEKKTRVFLEKRKEYIEKGLKFVSIDETSFGRKIGAVYGYSPKGEPIYMERNNIPQRTFSALCAVGSTNDPSTNIVTKIKEGAYNTWSFLEYLIDLKLERETVILLDNCSFHHSKYVKQLAQERDWILLYVPPYSPWFNPIEGVFSIVKRKYYKTGKIETSFSEVTASHVDKYFSKSFSVTRLLLPLHSDNPANPVVWGIRIPISYSRVVYLDQA